MFILELRFGFGLYEKHTSWSQRGSPLQSQPFSYFKGYLQWNIFWKFHQSFKSQMIPFSKPISCEILYFFLHCGCGCFKMKLLICYVICSLFLLYRAIVRRQQPVLRPGLTSVFWLMDHPAPACSTVYLSSFILPLSF